MKLSRIGRISMAFVVSVAMGLGMTACGGGTVGFMWVLGTQYNQIAGFKIDDFTGNLTAIPKSPFSSGGANPVSLVVKPGGRYLYVINKGGTTTGTGATLPCGTGGGIAEFSIGGEGALTFQQCFQSQGTNPIWATMDSTGSFLYVLDNQAPALKDGTLPANGDITVFSVANDTGRLTLVLNNQIKDPITGLQITYFPVGPNPTMLKLAGGGCLMTMNAGDQTIYPYTVGAAGQLTLTTNSTITTGATRLTSINANGNFVYLTDAGAAGTPGQILPYTVGTSCALSIVTGGPVPNLPSVANPVFSLVNSKGTRLYVLNQSSTNTTTPNSSISGFNILTNGQLQQLADTTNNPFAVGSAPVCMVQDPTFQYFYTSNGDGTVTGKIYDDTTGALSNLRRGSTFPATGQTTCLAVSGNVN
jgi:hypothetical protein